MTDEILELAPGVGPAAFSSGGRAAFETLFLGTRERGLAHLEIHLAALPRRVGRDQPWSGLINANQCEVDATHLRTCDVAAALLVLELDRNADSVGDGEAMLTHLYYQGDAEERRMILRSLPFLPRSSATITLLEEAHRTNDETLFAAGLLDSSLPARVLDEAAWNRIVLKVAFIGTEGERLFELVGRANATLSSMLLDFRRERLAAGRPVWGPTLEIASQAPCPGIVDAVVEDLNHGDPEARRAAARACLKVSDPRITEAAAARLTGEPEADIREILARSLA